jgi:lipopolysaccharide export system protein LptA
MTRSAKTRLLFLALLAAAGLSLAQSVAAAATKPAGPSEAPASPIQILPGTSSKEPISIDADKLVYYDKEHKAIYSGNVVVIQGDTKMTCSTMTVFLDRSPSQNGAPAPAAPQPTAGKDNASQDSGIRRLEAAGPVTVVSKTQVATGDNGSYDKLENKVQLIGHVTLSDGQNVTKGDKLTYDLKSGQATIDTAGSKSGRVHGQFTPNGAADPTKADPAKADSSKAK